MCVECVNRATEGNDVCVYSVREKHSIVVAVVASAAREVIYNNANKRVSGVCDKERERIREPLARPFSGRNFRRRRRRPRVLQAAQSDGTCATTPTPESCQCARLPRYMPCLPAPLLICCQPAPTKKL